MKCGQYWPNEEHTDEQFEEYIVYNNSIQTFKNYSETKLILHNTNVNIPPHVSPQFDFVFLILWIVFTRNMCSFSESYS